MTQLSTKVNQSQALLPVFLFQDEVPSVQMSSDVGIFPGFALFSCLLRSLRKTFQEFYGHFEVNTTGGTEGLSTVPLHLVAAQRLFHETQIRDFSPATLGATLRRHWGDIEDECRLSGGDDHVR